MKTLLICHEGAVLDQDGLARWLAASSSLVGMVVLQEKPARVLRRIRREVRRVGLLRFLDVLAFRLYYKLFLARQDRRWADQSLEEIRSKFPGLPLGLPVLRTHSPNSAEAKRFIADSKPEIMIARCKTLLKEEIFSLASMGTFVLHPGICPEYRNAHGCFWALAQGDRDHVGMTLLKIDKGIDTGPIYGYFRCDFDETRETHVVIQHRVVLENLEALASKLAEIGRGEARPLTAAGRPSGEWGQPWLTRYFRIRRRAKVTK